MAMGQLQHTPVAFFLFNRPDATRRVFESIANARPPRLFVIADGPREDRHNEDELCRQARAVIERVNWKCEVITNYSGSNLGCKHRIASGLDWVFSQTEEAIILEDDCLPGPSFFPFCEELLERYRFDERIQMIRGTNVALKKRFGSASYHFSRFYGIWGWATWARAWKYYDVTMSRWADLRKGNWIEGHLPTREMAQLMRYFFDETHTGRMDTWDYQWVLSGWLRRALAIAPSQNLVANIGFGVDATHTHEEDTLLSRLQTETITFPLQHPSTVAVMEAADLDEWSQIYPGAGTFLRTRRNLRSYLSRILRLRHRG